MTVWGTPPNASLIAAPAALRWPFTTYPLNVYRNGTKYGSQVSTDFVPQKYINPACYANVIHCTPTGAGTFTGIGLYTGDFTNAAVGLQGAVINGNASAKPYMILAQSGTYYRNTGGAFSGAGGTTAPTQDCAVIAYGGRVVTGCFDNLTYALDGVQTNCYSVGRTNVCRVIDLLNNNSFGANADITCATTLALCNSTPGTWFNDGTKTYVHRADGAPVTSLNTRTFLNIPTSVLLNHTSGNVYFENCDIYGAGANGCISSLDGTMRVGNTVLNNCTVGYQGFISATVLGWTTAVCSGNRCIAFDNTQGLAAFVNCTAYSGCDDAFNFHWSQQPNVAATLFPLTINCTAIGMGAYNSSSVNGFTTHDSICGIDIGGNYQYNRGGNVACILGVSASVPTQTWCVGTSAKFSVSDAPLGGSQVPQDFWMDGTINGTPSQMWLDGCLSGCAPYSTTADISINATNNAIIWTRNVTNASGTTAGVVMNY